MNQMRCWQLFAKHNKSVISRSSGFSSDSSNHFLERISSNDAAPTFHFLRRYWRSTTSEHSSGRASLLEGDSCRFQGLNPARLLQWRRMIASTVEGSPLCLKEGVLAVSRRFNHTKGTGNHLNRDFLAQLWIADRKRESSTRKVQPKIVKHQNDYHGEVDLKQPPPSQTISSFLQPTSPMEAQVATLLARSNLLITRDIEWANLMLGFEQENRYAILDVCYPNSPVGLIREQSGVLARQFLRTRRPFVAYITDSAGNELFRVRRPFWWITSSIYAEINGQEIGVVHRRWHLWRRIYDLYLGDRQFAVVENPGLWNWTFTLKDIDGNVLAQIDRDWRGFGFEIFTDAGQYVIRFGSSDPDSKAGHARSVQDLEVVRPLTLSERAIAVALAISLDNDYFSRHGGWDIPFIAVGE